MPSNISFNTQETLGTRLDAIQTPSSTSSFAFLIATTWFFHDLNREFYFVDKDSSHREFYNKMASNDLTLALEDGKQLLVNSLENSTNAAVEEAIGVFESVGKVWSDYLEECHPTTRPW